MTPEEIEEDWQRQTFGTTLKDTNEANKQADEYSQFINDFLTGRSKFDRMPARSKLPTTITSALKVFELGVTASWRDVGTKYRQLAKKYHPDTATDKENAATEFARISAAYDILKKHFGKK
jgi:DnaJ-domain-containing protein 1